MLIYETDPCYCGSRSSYQVCNQNVSSGILKPGCRQKTDDGSKMKIDFNCFNLAFKYDARAKIKKLVLAMSIARKLQV